MGREYDKKKRKETATSKRARPCCGQASSSESFCPRDGALAPMCKAWRGWGQLCPSAPPTDPAIPRIRAQDLLSKAWPTAERTQWPVTDSHADEAPANLRQAWHTAVTSSEAAPLLLGDSLTWWATVFSYESLAVSPWQMGQQLTQVFIFNVT